MDSRAKRIGIGCGLGCLGIVVVGISSCIGFQVWINTPGELLQTERLLDPLAVGWAEARLDLEDEGTEALASALVSVSRPPEGMFEGSPILGLFSELNARRQERQMRRLFPMTASWTLYPGEPGEPDATLIAASVPRMARTLTLVDWGLGFVARRAPEMVTETYRGERIVVIDEPDRNRTRAGTRTSVREGAVRIEAERDHGRADGAEMAGTAAELEEGVAPDDEVRGDDGFEMDSAELDSREDDSPASPSVTVHFFLRDVGVFFATSGDAARRAIDGLVGRTDATSGSPLAALVADLGAAPIRGALLNDDTGRLARVLDRLLDDGVLDDETRRLLGDAESATLVGRFGDAGELELTLTLAGLEPAEAITAALEAAATRLLEAHPELGGSAGVEAAPGGVTVRLTLPLAQAAERAVEDRRIIVR